MLLVRDKSELKIESQLDKIGRLVLDLKIAYSDLKDLFNSANLDSDIKRDLNSAILQLLDVISIIERLSNTDKLTEYVNNGALSQIVYNKIDRLFDSVNRLYSKLTLIDKELVKNNLIKVESLVNKISDTRSDYKSLLRVLNLHTSPLSLHLEDTPGLNLSPYRLDLDKGLIYVTINGIEYAYKPVDVPLTDLFNSITGIAKYSPGKSLAYLKKHAISGRVESIIEAITKKLSAGDSIKYRYGNIYRVLTIEDIFFDPNQLNIYVSYVDYDKDNPDDKTSNTVKAVDFIRKISVLMDVVDLFE